MYSYLQQDKAEIMTAGRSLELERRHSLLRVFSHSDLSHPLEFITAKLAAQILASSTFDQRHWRMS